MPSEKQIELAKKVASESLHEFQVGAILYKGSVIISQSCNTLQYMGYRRKHFPYKPTRHAEMGVLHNINRDVLKKCSVLVVRINRKGELTSAKPCKACLSAMLEAKIKRIFYSNYDGQLVKLKLSTVKISTYSKEIR